MAISQSINELTAFRFSDKISEVAGRPTHRFKSFNHMEPEFYRRLNKLLSDNEGRVNHLYLDTVGKPTVGVGNMLPTAESACKLPFRILSNDGRANINLITDEYELIRSKEWGKVANYYRQFCHLYLPESDIDELLDDRVDEFEIRLRTDFLDFETYPENVQLALFDMAFNLGNDGLMKKFPKFCNAIKSKNWPEAAIQSRRPQLSVKRNEEIRKLFEGFE